MIHAEVIDLVVDRVCRSVVSERIEGASLAAERSARWDGRLLGQVVAVGNLSIDLFLWEDPRAVSSLGILQVLMSINDVLVEAEVGHVIVDRVVKRRICERISGAGQAAERRAVGIGWLLRE